MPDRKTFWILLTTAFLFRFVFGLLCSHLNDLDHLQTYLIGLKCYTTHTWPFFGPDVYGSEGPFQSQIPGALEGLLIGLPFYLLPIPEAPILFLNLMSITAIALLAWYIVKRIPEIPYIWLFIWISVLPFIIQETTNTINPAYIFLPSVIFFISFMESIPWFSLGLVTNFWRNFGIGFSLFWIMQFHFSYVYLIPLSLWSLVSQIVHNRKFKSVQHFLIGALMPLMLVIPTYLKYGLATNDVASGFMSSFNRENIKDIWTILYRFSFLPCYELHFELPKASFSQTVQILLSQNLFVFIPFVILWVAGHLQWLVLFGIWTKEIFMSLWKKKLLTSNSEWIKLNWFLAAVFLMVYISFWFTIKKPLSHIYFIFFPLLMLYCCHAFVQFKNNRYGVITAKTCVILGVILQMNYAIFHASVDSIYSRNTFNQIELAIQLKDYKILAERRPGSLY